MTRSMLRGRMGTWRRGPRGDLRDFHRSRLFKLLSILSISSASSAISIISWARNLEVKLSQTLEHLGKQNTLVTGATFGAGVLEQ